MAVLLKGGMVYQNRKFIKADLLMEGGVIKDIGTEIPEADARIVDVEGMRIVPGFLDIHTHGAVGVDVNGARAEDYEKICRFHVSQGTTGWLCSVLTDTREQTMRCIGEYQRWKALEHKGSRLLGIHLEGPFLSPEYKGAMPEHLLRKPDLDLVQDYQKAAKGEIRYITVSPELEGMEEFIPRLCRLEMTVAIGHSGADYETARKAIAAGAMAATHTGNAMRLLHQHEPAIWGAVLEEEKVYCEMICDGRHLHPGTVRLILKTKGLDRAVAITDSIMAAGLPDGNYKLGVNDVVVREGDARLAKGGSRAGSTLVSRKALENLLAFTGRPLEELLPLMTENPAKLIGVYDRVGSLEAGKDADLVVLEENCRIGRTYVKGECCFSGKEGKIG